MTEEEYEAMNSQERAAFDERFRYCIYCRADCAPWIYEQQHSDDCPTTTRIFPVREGEFRDGLRCADCEAELETGDTYTTRNLGLGEPPVYEIICTTCAVLDPDLETI